MLKKLILIIFICSLIIAAKSEDIKINELMPKNAFSLFNNDYKAYDWIELYNTSPNSINLKNYRIYDKNDYAKAYILPDTVIPPKSFLNLFASGIDTVVTNAFSIESSGYGVNQSVLLAGYRFDYLRVYGDFEIYVEVPSIEPFENGSPHCGLFVSEKLDDKSPFVALYYQNINYSNSYWFCYRDSVLVTPKYELPQFINPNRVGHLRMKRIGDTVYAYCEDKEGYVFQTSSRFFAAKYVYIGIATASSDMYRITRFSFRNLKINGQNYDFKKLYNFEINTKISGKKYLSKEIHTNFKLSEEGETVYLWNPEGELIDSFKFPKMTPDVSIGRLPDGSDSIFFFRKGTPSKSNNISEFYLGITEAPSFSASSSWFNETTKVQIINIDSSQKIYYTLDGSVPTTNSEHYDNQEFEINKNTVIKAMAFKDNYLPSEIITKTFFMNESSSLPVVSISCEISELTNEDKTGMFDRRFEDIRSTINFEFFDKNKNLVFNSPMEMRLFGHGVARGWSQPSLRLDTRKYLGSKNLNYKFFGENSLSEYETLRLRNSSGDWTHSFLRDVFVSELAKRIPSQLSASFQPVLSFINGEFFGLYNLREHLNESFLAVKYNIPEDSINIIRNFTEVTAGSVNSLFRFLDFLFKSNIEDSTVIKEIRKNLDLNNIFDYTILSLYTSNYDWPFNNIIAWQSMQYDGRWRFICNDFDWSFGLDNYVTHPENDCVFRFFANRDSSGWLFSKIVTKLLENQNLKNKFLNRAADLLNSTFLSDPVIQLIDSVHHLYEQEIDRQRAKHSDCMEFRDESHQAMIDFAEKRPDILRQHIVEQFNLSGTAKLKLSSNIKNLKIRVNSLLIDLNKPFEGIYFKDVPIDIKIVNSNNYEFVGWSKKDIPNQSYLKLILEDSTELIAIFKVDAELQPIVINEIMYKPSNDKDCRDWFELYNPNNRELILDGYVFKDDNDAHIYNFPNSTVIPPFGYLVVSENPTEFKKFYSDVSNIIGGFSFGIGTKDKIRIFDSFGVLVDSVEYKNSVPWPLGADGTGYSIELTNPTLDNNRGENWKVSSIFLGTPGKANSTFSSVEKFYLTANQYFKVYPNPANDYITISIDNSINDDNSFVKENQINIYNSLGECVISERQKFENKYRIKISELAPGFYFIKYSDLVTYFIKI
ncbi:MAG: lamin tail domain-containing protein [Candidatus Kapabacteria bacterium]|nr:lamin tail domain-containing protein [Candidatus Kapabacteria bacterium]